MGSITYNKLIRDKIPQIIEKSGKIAVVETLGNEEYKRLLDAKLNEELQEYLSDDSNDSIEELADLVEVVYAILKYKGIDIDEFEGIRLKKAAERGTFEKRLFLREVMEK